MTMVLESGFICKRGQRVVEKSTPPLSTERKHAKCLSILRTGAQTLVKTCRRKPWRFPLILENGCRPFVNIELQVYYELSRIGLHPLLKVDVKSTMNYQEWV